MIVYVRPSTLCSDISRLVDPETRTHAHNKRTTKNTAKYKAKANSHNTQLTIILETNEAKANIQRNRFTIVTNIRNASS